MTVPLCWLLSQILVLGEEESTENLLTVPLHNTENAVPSFSVIIFAFKHVI